MDKKDRVQHIVSVSRRTDIPAFYGSWFMEQVRQGEAVVLHPYRHLKQTVSLRPDDVAAFVFWSKNYIPFFKHLDELDARNYKYVFFFTITGLPRILEPKVPDIAMAVATFKALSKRYSPKHVLWRYDPIVLSSRTSPEYHVKNFRALCQELEGYTDRCYLSFANLYPKVKKNFRKLANSGWEFLDLPEREKIHLAEHIADIATAYGIDVYSCCNNFLVGNKIKKARCIDADLLARLFGLDIANYKIRPTRSQCGCFESIDIGTYNTCQHSCIYCYASHRTHAHESEELTDSTLKYDSVLNTHKEVRSSSDKMQHIQLSFNFLK